MARKPVLEGGKKDELIDAALALFFENGYENTSIRMIANRVGCEVGCFITISKIRTRLFPWPWTVSFPATRVGWRSWSAGRSGTPIGS